MSVISKRTSVLIERVRLTAWTERRALLQVGVGLATAAWAFVVSRDAALQPLITIPILAAARYRDRQLGAIAVGVASVLGALLSRIGSLEMAVWHAFVLGFALSALYCLAERFLASAQPANDPIARFLADAGKSAASDLAIVVECDGLEDLDDRYGAEARQHVASLLRRAIESETTRRDLVARTGDQEFVVVLQGANLEEAHEVLNRVRHSFSRAVSDAGYECSISVAYSQVERDQETIPHLMRHAESQRPLMDAQPYGAFLN